MTQPLQLGSRNVGPIDLVPLPLNGFLAVDGLLGISVFAHHRVCFDGKRGVVSIR